MSEKYLPYSEAIAKRVIAIMDEKGITRGRLAAKLNIAPPQVTKWLSGSVNFTIESLLEIAEALGESITDILPSKTKLELAQALAHPLWVAHQIGDEYTMDGKPDLWKIAYYPIFEDGETGKVYNEPRALIEKPMPGGTDFREIPLRYLTKYINGQVSDTTTEGER